MSYKERAEVKIDVNKGSCAQSGDRRFQASVVPNAILAGDDLVEMLAEHSFAGSVPLAANAIRGIEEFIVTELKKGNRLDFGLASFYPRLSAALSSRDCDPAEDGVSVRGAVKAKIKLIDAAAEVVAVNETARDVIRIDYTHNPQRKEFDIIRPGEDIVVYSRNVQINGAHADEGFVLEKRSGKNKCERQVIARARLIGVHEHGGLIIRFDEELPSINCSLVALTRAGKSKDFALRHIGHPVKSRPRI